MVENGFIPGWIKNIKEENVKESAAQIDRAVRRVQAKRRDYQRDKIETKAVEIEIAEENLRGVLLEIYQKESSSKDGSLWIVIGKVIKGKVIGGSLGPFYLKELYFALRDLEDEEKEEGNKETGIFYGRLAVRINERDIAPYRAIIAGGVLTENMPNGDTKFHYFPPIPFWIRKKAGVKCSTHPENRESIKEAYRIMIGNSATEANRRATEAHLEDVQQIFNNMDKTKK